MTFVVALRKLTRREHVKHVGHGSYKKDFHYLQYQTNDGEWHDVPEVFEDSTTHDCRTELERQDRATAQAVAEATKPLVEALEEITAMAQRFEDTYYAKISVDVLAAHASKHGGAK